MKIDSITLSIEELRQAIRDYIEKHSIPQPESVFVESPFHKVVLDIPLGPGTVVRGEAFKVRTDDL